MPHFQRLLAVVAAVEARWCIYKDDTAELTRVMQTAYEGQERWFPEAELASLGGNASGWEAVIQELRRSVTSTRRRPVRNADDAAQSLARTLRNRDGFDQCRIFLFSEDDFEFSCFLKKISNFRKIFGFSEEDFFCLTVHQRETKRECRRFVLIYENRIIVDRRFVNHTKHGAHAKMMSPVRPLGNAAYSFSGTTSGFSGRCRDPCLMINKQYGYNQCGVLVPNTYFAYGDLAAWRNFEHSIKAVSKEWASRPYGKAFWRGTLTVSHQCLQNWGNFARQQALALTVTHPDLVDVGCVPLHGNVTKTCLAGLGVSPQNCTGLPRPPPLDLVPAAAAPLRDVVPLENYTHQKILLNLPGAKSGSYSRNLNYLWMMGAVVLLWNGPFTEWLYPALRDGVTHLTVDARTLPETVRLLNDTTELIKNARWVHDNFLCADCIRRYFEAVIHHLRIEYKMDLVLDDPQRARNLFRSVGFDIDCQKLVEILHDDPPAARKDVIMPGEKVVKMRSLGPDDPVCGSSSSSSSSSLSSSSSEELL